MPTPHPSDGNQASRSLCLCVVSSLFCFFLSLNLNAFRAASSARRVCAHDLNPEGRGVFKDILRHEIALSDSVRIAVAKSVEYALKNGHTPEEPQMREAVFYAIDVLEEGLRLRKDFFPFIVSLGNFYPLVSADPDRVERGISILREYLNTTKIDQFCIISCEDVSGERRPRTRSRERKKQSTCIRRTDRVIGACGD